MKKGIITLIAVAVLSTCTLLASCGSNSAMGNGNNNETPSQSTTENGTDKNIVDDVESIIGDAAEDATHGETDGIPGGHSQRGGNRTLFPRGK